MVGRWMQCVLSLLLLPTWAEGRLRPCEEERLAGTAMEDYHVDRNSPLKEVGLDAIYVAHYTPYKDRRKLLESTFDRLGLGATFITGWDRNNFTEDDVVCLYPSNAYYERVAIARNYPMSWLKKGELGLSLKHAAAYYDAVRRGHRNILVLEDDVVFAENFVSELTETLSDEAFRKEYDVLFLGSYWPSTKEEIARGPRIVDGAGPKATEGYLVSQKAAQHLMDNMPIRGPSDHMISSDHYPNAPPKRYSRLPWLVWQGTRDSKWPLWNVSTEWKGFELVVGEHACVGCKCPKEYHTLSAHIVVFENKGSFLRRKTEDAPTMPPKNSTLDSYNANIVKAVREKLELEYKHRPGLEGKHVDDDYLLKAVQAVVMENGCSVEDMLRKHNFLPKTV